MVLVACNLCFFSFGGYCCKSQRVSYQPSCAQKKRRLCLHQQAAFRGFGTLRPTTRRHARRLCFARVTGHGPTSNGQSQPRNKNGRESGVRKCYCCCCVFLDPAERKKEERSMNKRTGQRKKQQKKRERVWFQSSETIRTLLWQQYVPQSPLSRLLPSRGRGGGGQRKASERGQYVPRIQQILGGLRSLDSTIYTHVPAFFPSPETI